MQFYRILRFFILLITVVGGIGATALYAADAPPNVTLTASQPTLTVGDVVTVTLQVTHTVSDTLLPLALDRTWGDFEVRNLSAVVCLSKVTAFGKWAAVPRRWLPVRPP